MKKVFLPVGVCLVLLLSLVVPAWGAPGGPLQKGIRLADSGQPPRAPAVIRYNPDALPVHLDPPLRPDGSLAPQSSSFSITYIAAGGKNAYNEPCLEFPAAAKTAFNAAAAVWGSLLNSSVPITIEACWANLGANVLGYSGSLDFWRDFSGAPVPGTWYPASLANARYGSDLDPAYADMSIAYANGYSGEYYYGTDGNPGGAKLDFMSLVMHEIAHGLGFAGSMEVNGTTASWGSSTIYPEAYDRFAVDSLDRSLINTAVYPNNSAQLLAVLQTAVFFNGTNAKAGNAGSQVPLYSPSSWKPGSSYAHVSSSYDGTDNALMTYSLGHGEVIHVPGSIALGVLKDVGWNLSVITVAAPSGLNAVPASANQVNLSWADNGAGETGFKVERSPDGSTGWVTLNPAAPDQTYVDTAGIVEGARYYYRVSAVYPGPQTSSPSNVAAAITPLLAAGGLVATSISPTEINLAWTDPNSTETGYLVERSLDGVGGWSTIITTAASATAFSDTGLGESTRYYYRVTAVNALITSPAALANALTGLKAPTGLTAAAVSPAQVNLAWTDNSSKETGYRIERGPAAAGPWTLVTTTAANAASYPDSGVSEGEAYFYQVTAVNAIPLESAPLVSASPVVVPLKAPTGLTAALGSAGQVALTWTDVSAAETGYRVERGPAAAGPWTLVATAAANAADYGDTGMAELSTHYYRVRAVSAATTAESAPLVSNPVTTVLAVPTGLVAYPLLGGGKIQLAWTDASAAEIGYQIQQALAPAGPWTDLDTTAPNTSSCLWVQPVNGVYFFRVRALGDPEALNSAFAGPTFAVLGSQWVFLPSVRK